MITEPSDRGAKRQHGTPSYARRTSVEAVLADSELTPAGKLETLIAWDKDHGIARSTGHGRVAGASDLGFPNPAPYSPEVQRSIVELYRLHRKDLPESKHGPWFEHLASTDS